MNWSDERYVKLYSRNTATWVTWPWQARAALPLFLRVADGAGLLDCGRREPLRALAALVMLPVEVVEVAVAAMVEDGTLEVVERGWLLPHYLEAQEATKTPALKKRDQRDRDRAKAREITMAPVTECHRVSPSVPLQPSPAQPTTSPAQEEVVAPLRVASPSVGELVEAWNGLPHPPFPACHAVAGKRLRAAQARLREVPDIDRWRRAVARLPTSPFLRGENDRGWVATLDWLLRPDTLTKLEEGAYDARSPRGPTLVTPGEGAIQATIGEML